jgi:hypothetical protein
MSDSPLSATELAEIAKRDLVCVSYDPQLGDALMALPAICALAKKHSRVFLEMQNRAVCEIADFPENVHLNLWGNDARDPAFVFLGMAAAINYRFEPGMLHPTQSLIRMAGLPVPDEVPQPRIKRYFRRVESFDVILAPFASAPERTLDVRQVEALVKKLQDGTDKRIAILGGGTNPNVPIAVPHLYDYPLDYAAQLLRQCRVFVGVDSFPNRLAHAAGCERAFVLDTGATPVQTQTWPGCTALQAYNVPLIAKKVLEAL